MTRAVVLATFLATFVSGCAGMKPMVARRADLEDYRAFRVAAAQGMRLARAKQYLEAHPDGAWSAEVRAAFDEEEPRYFEVAKRTPEGARRYLADLPEGPHAAAALAVLIAFGSSVEDAELRDLIRRVRYEDAKLEVAAVQRRAVEAGILTTLGAMLDDGVYGVRRAELPMPMRRVLLGAVPTTWGGIPARREDDYFFLLPTRPERESRLVTLEVSLVEERGVVVGSRLEGSDLLVRWAEAAQIVRLDPSSLSDRMEAQIFTMARLEGALERRFPTGACSDLRAGSELYHRACGGWEAVVRPAEREGDKDVIVIRGPRDKKEPGVGAVDRQASDPRK
jgi:hypothetical protein